jgi:hypothetical protein
MEQMDRSELLTKPRRPYGFGQHLHLCGRIECPEPACLQDLPHTLAGMLHRCRSGIQRALVVPPRLSHTPPPSCASLTQINRPALRFLDPFIHSREGKETSFFPGSFAAYRTEPEDGWEEVKSSIRR